LTRPGNIAWRRAVRNSKKSDALLRLLLFLVVAVIVFGVMLTLTKSLPQCGLPIVVVGAITILLWIFR
jgi:predicted membrane channel-forming protein YqfA (hemolysin III family)